MGRADRRGTESYAGARSFYRFENTVKELTGFKHIIPTHQGRESRRSSLRSWGGRVGLSPNNTHFDTTRANIEVSGAEAVDLPVKEALVPLLVKDFKGNMDITALERLLKQKGPEHIPLVMMTVTNNSCAGQPVSMGCIRRVSDLCRSYKIPFFIDVGQIKKTPGSSRPASRGARAGPSSSLPRRCSPMPTAAP